MRFSKRASQAYHFLAAHQPRWWKDFRSFLGNRFLTWMVQRLKKLHPNLYYGKFAGSDAPGLLLVKNILSPKRFLLKLSYGQAVPLPKAFLLSESLPAGFIRSQETSSWARSFKSNGFVILPGYFQEQIQGLAERYCAEPQKNPRSKELTVRYLSLLDEAFAKIILQETMLSTIGQIFGCQPFIQDLPVITVVDTLHPPAGPKEEEIVTEWHSDNVNTIKLLVFLNDVEESGVRMLIAKASHAPCRTPLDLNDSLYSDEYVRSKYQVVDCVGPKGTVVIFDSNALHKQLRAPKSFRAMLAVKYSAGSGFNFSKKHTEGYFELTRAEQIFSSSPLSSIQRRALKGILDTAALSRSPPNRR